KWCDAGCEFSCACSPSGVCFGGIFRLFLAENEKAVGRQRDDAALVAIVAGLFLRHDLAAGIADVVEILAVALPVRVEADDPAPGPRKTDPVIFLRHLVGERGDDDDVIPGSA